VFKIISRNLIQKRTEDIDINKTILPLGLKQTQVATIEGINETQSIGIHDVLKGLQSIIGRFQTLSAFYEFFEVVESFTAKEEDGLTSYFVLDVLEAKIFRYNFMEGHNV